MVRLICLLPFAAAILLAQGTTLSVTPGSLAFEFIVGGKNPADKEFTVTSGTGAFSVQVSALAQSWLSVNPTQVTSASGAVKLTVSVDPGSLAPGTFTGTVTVSATGATSQTATVTLVVKPVSPTLEVTPTVLVFDYLTGAPVQADPAAQQLTVSGKGTNLYFSAAAVSTPAGWLAVSPARGLVLPTVPSVLQVSVKPSGLAPGAYKGTVTLTLTSAGATSVKPVTVAVTLTVSAPPPTLNSVTPSGAEAGSKDTTITLLGDNFFKTSKVRLGTGDIKSTFFDSKTMTAVVPAKSMASEGPLEIAVVTPAPGGGVSGSATFEVGPLGPQTSAAGVVNAASFLSGSIAPGEIVTIFGSNLGPAALTQAPAGLTGLPKTVAETQVLFSGTAAPLLYVQANQVSAIVPYGIPATGQVPVQVQYKTASSAPVQLTAAATAPALFTLDGSGRGQAAAINENTSVNGSTARAARGSTISLFLTGGGVMNPAATDGEIQSCGTPPVPGLKVPSSLSFFYSAAGAAPPAQTFTVSSSGAQAFSFAAAAASTGNWLQVTPSSGTTPATLTVSVVPGSLVPGVYAGTVTLTASGAANSPQQVAVSLTVAAPATASPASLAFFHQTGAAAPAAQNVTLSPPGASPVPFVAAAATSSGGNWLAVSPAAGYTTSGPLSVTVNPTGVAAGSYSGTVTLTIGGVAQTIAVTLTEGAGPYLAASASSLEFLHQAGGAAPASQNLMVSSSGAAVNVTASAGAAWLTVSPGSLTNVTTAQALTVTADPTGLAAGAYTSQVILTPAGGGTSLSVAVTLSVAAAGAAPTIGLSAPLLSFSTVTGSTTAQTQNLVVSTSLPAPLAFSTTAISSGNWLAVSPPGGSAAPGATLTVTVTPPAGLAAGTYTGVITVNSPGPPAAANQPQTVPVTLTITAAPPASAAVVAGPVSVTLGSGSAAVTLNGPVGPANPITYFSHTPCAVNGLLEMIFTVPANAPTGPSVPVSVSIGAATTQPGVTVAIN